MSERTVTAQYWIGARVRLAFALDTEAVVIAVLFEAGHVEYQCAWFAEHARKTEWFTEDELTDGVPPRGAAGFSPGGNSQ